MPWKSDSADWMAASGTPRSLATAMTASALSTLWAPGRLSVTRSAGRPSRSTSNSVRKPRRRTLTARRSASSDKP